MNKKVKKINQIGWVYKLPNGVVQYYIVAKQPSICITDKKPDYMFLDIGEYVKVRIKEL